MSDSSDELEPKTEAGSSGGPPRPPKKTARGLDDESPDDPLKNLSAAERAELEAWIEEWVKKEQ